MQCEAFPNMEFYTHLKIGLVVLWKKYLFFENEEIILLRMHCAQVLSIGQYLILEQC